MRKSNKPIETRVYYGEYTLRHWIELMLTKGIELPEYQRSFVWSEEDVKRLLASLNSGQFILPVTIAHYKDENGEQNLILDGQQRLTSILLAYLGFMPIKEKFNSRDVDLANGDDSEEDGKDSSMEWTYKMLLKEIQRENTTQKLQDRLRGNDHYKELKVVVDGDVEEFYDRTFLGFSFIIPAEQDANATQRYFSELFRNMNYLGKKLSPLESRRSLYFMNREYKDYFDGKTTDGDDILCNIKILENMQPRKIDFVRYLSMLSQLMVVKDNELKRVMVGYSAYSSRESYYADYVSYIVNLEQESRKDKFNGFGLEKVFPNHEWKDRFKTVKEFLERNKAKMGLDEKNGAFTSWIDADYWLFGLLDAVLFKGKTLENEDVLTAELVGEISAKRRQKDGEPASEYQKNPNRIGNLRDRIGRSLAIYASHAK